MICPKCGNEIKEGMAFCSKCGNPVKAAGNQNSIGTGQVNNGFNITKYKKYIVIAIAVIIIIVVGKKLMGGTSVSGGFSSLEDAVNAYISAMEDRNVEEFLNCFPKDLREDISKGIDASYFDNGDTIHSPYKFMQAEDGYLEYSFVGSKDMSQEELDSYNNKYNYNAKEGKFVEIKFSHSFESMGGIVKRSNTVTVPIVKIGKKWYALEPADITGGWPLEY
ncbi:MAG: zinc ribbon domain-containing protein [Lachnospiraceae bacterium]|nr:zinc ribbon domain-containing protein [Lachnospiraceae bacterium]